MDLVIKNGTIVTASETYQADIGIKDGAIGLIGQGLDGDEVIDATDKYVMPGGVDVHVHLQMTIGGAGTPLGSNSFGDITSSDDFTTGTIAAACGGTTTVIDFITPQPGQSLHQAVAERRSQADGRTAIDYGLHLTATNARPETLAEIEELAAAGYTSLKLYTTYPALMVNDAEMLDLMAAAAACGVLPIVHAENHWMIEYLKQKLLAEAASASKGKTEPRYHPRSRPPLAEAEAANRVLALARLTECPVYLAHMTCRESLEVVRKYQAQGQRVYGEVCTQHLILSEDEYERPGFEGAKFVLSPPLRDKSNWEPLWHALAAGTLQAISTDHCPWMFATHKQRGQDDFTKIPNGAPGIETRVPLIHHFGVNQGRFSINKFVELVSTAPAQLFGLWPRKGTVAVGSDADLVIFDPHREHTLTRENLHMNVDYSPYKHITVRGYPVMTIAGGKVIVKDNEFVGRVGGGQFLERKPFAMEQRSKEQRSKATRQRGNEATGFLCSPAPLLPRSPALLTWAEIDLDAIAHNVRELKRCVGETTQLMAVVKANGYGHGAVPVAEVALENGASRLAVNRAVEGVQLRQAGITAPVLILGYTLPAQAETIVRWNLTPTVNTQEQAQAFSSAASSQDKVLPIHVKVDTGLGRFGLLPDEVLSFVRAISALPSLSLEGIYTHFALADAADKAYTLEQFDIYLEVVKRLEEAEGNRGGGLPALHTIPIKHVANSAATLDLPETHLDLVRCGIALYGMRPSTEVEPAIPLRPAMTLKSRVARVRTLPAGSSISYGCTYTTSEPTPVALVPVGYGDGYHRLISNRGQVLIRGQRAPIVGRVCMDQFVVKVGHIPNVQQDDEVVILGRQGDDEISAEEVAAWAETINYEVTTSILPRVTRVYFKGGQVVAVHSLVETSPQSTF